MNFLFHLKKILCRFWSIETENHNKNARKHFKLHDLMTSYKVTAVFIRLDGYFLSKQRISIFVCQHRFVQTVISRMNVVGCKQIVISEIHLWIWVEISYVNYFTDILKFAKKPRYTEAIEMHKTKEKKNGQRNRCCRVVYIIYHGIQTLLLDSKKKATYQCKDDVFLKICNCIHFLDNQSSS